MELTNFLNNEDGEKEVSPIIGNSYITTLTVLLNLYEFDELIWEALFRLAEFPSFSITPLGPLLWIVYNLGGNTWN